MSSLILKPSENLADPSWANRHTMDWDLRKIYLKTKNCSDSTSLALGCAVSSKLNISRFEACSVQNGVHQMLLCTTLPEAWGTQSIDLNIFSANNYKLISVRNLIKVRTPITEKVLHLPTIVNFYPTARIPIYIRISSYSWLTKITAGEILEFFLAQF